MTDDTIHFEVTSPVLTPERNEIAQQQRPIMHMCAAHRFPEECGTERRGCVAYCGNTESHYAATDPYPPKRDWCVVCHDLWRESRR